MSEVLITRTTGGDTTNGEPVPHRGDGRVYVDRVHWSRHVYSSTTDRERATRFDREEAERLIRNGHWSRRAPEIEEA